MVKQILLCGIVLLPIQAETTVDSPLQEDCLACHEAQKVPSEFIYRRYLMKYSSKDTVKEKLFSYIKAPSQNNSVMPPQFFGKYVVKELTELDDGTLKERIDDYIKFYDVSKKLFVPNQ